MLLVELLISGSSLSQVRSEAIHSVYKWLHKYLLISDNIPFDHNLHKLLALSYLRIESGQITTKGHM